MQHVVIHITATNIIDKSLSIPCFPIQEVVDISDDDGEEHAPPSMDRKAMIQALQELKEYLGYTCEILLYFFNYTPQEFRTVVVPAFLSDHFKKLRQRKHEQNIQGMAGEPQEPAIEAEITPGPGSEFWVTHVMIKVSGIEQYFKKRIVYILVGLIQKCASNMWNIYHPCTHLVYPLRLSRNPGDGLRVSSSGWGQCWNPDALQPSTADEHGSS